MLALPLLDPTEAVDEIDAALDGRPTPDLPAGAPGRDAEAGDVLRWTFDRYAGRRIVTTTSFGFEGCVLIDMLSRLDAATGMDVIYLDTHFFFPETLALRDRMAERYPSMNFVNAGTDLTAAEQERLYGPKLWETDPNRCCDLRKVQPMSAALAGVDVWLTALRRGQSSTRANLPTVGLDPQYGVVKVSPLAAWTRQAVVDYALANDVPYNELHERGYPSVGCTHCTRPVAGSSLGDYSRAGRWSGTGKVECGLHLTPDGRLERVASPTPAESAPTF